MTRILSAMLLLFTFGCSTNHTPSSYLNRKIPVILDTDIGDDIDDTWALLFLLKSPQFDVKLITTDNGQQDYRARLIAKLLTSAGRTDIPIGLGAGEWKYEQKQAPWIVDFPLSKYAGTVHKDGPAAIIEKIHRSPTPITLIAIGPVQTIAASLERDPSIAPRTHYVGMQGSIAKPVAEWNVKCSIPSAQKVLAAPWKSTTITPLDTCGRPDVCIESDRFEKLKQSNDPIVKVLLQNYAIWKKASNPSELTRSTTLYDTVAICLADPHCRQRLNCQQLNIKVTDTGITEVGASGHPINVAMTWNDLDRFKDHLEETLLSPAK